MNKRQLEVEKIKLAAEAKELEELKAIYQKAADDISKKIRISDGKINVLLQNFDDLDDKQKSILQSQIYQRKFQQSLKQQIDDFTNALVAGQYESIDDYMRSCYEVGFLGAMYDIQGQGVPLVMPIDEKQVIKAMQTNSKISKRLYTKLGEDVDALKKRIASSLSRGIATADSYANIARNITADSNVGFNRAMRIARTEGHRIQANSAFDAQQAAKAAGADVVKQWDSTLDGKTRPHHRQLDGQIRELEEPFEVGGMEAMYPSDFGRASEDVNCRCALLQRARWALDDGEFTKMNNFTKELETFDSPKSYDEFKKGFFSDGNVKYMNYVQQMEKKYKTKEFAKVLSSMTEREYKHYSKLLAKNPVFNTSVAKTANKAVIKPSASVKSVGGTVHGKNSKAQYNTYDDYMEAIENKLDGQRKISFGWTYEEALKDFNSIDDFIDGEEKVAFLKLQKEIEKLQKKLKKDIINGKISLENCGQAFDFDTLKAHFKNKYSIKMDSSVKKLDFESVKEGMQGIELVMNEFPQAQKALVRISTNKDGVMCASYNGTINFNPTYYTDRTQAVLASRSTGFHPKGSNVVSTGSHEMGHILEKALIDKNGGGIAGRIAWDDCTYSKAVVSDACKSAKKTAEGKGKTNTVLKGEISGYAKQDASECLAEAVADYIINGENASILSKEIWKILKKELG